MLTRCVGLAAAGWMCLVATGAGAEERPIVAVFDMEDRGKVLSREVLDSLTDYLAVLLAEGDYQVVPRDQLRERLIEGQQESHKACYDQSCQVELGRELAAQKILTSKILKIGTTCKVTATLFDLRKAATDKAATGGGKCDENDLLQAVEQVAAKLTGRQQAGPSPTDDEARLAEEKRKAREAWIEERRRKAALVKQPPSTPPPVRPVQPAVAHVGDHWFRFGMLANYVVPGINSGGDITFADSDGTLATKSGALVDIYADFNIGRLLALGTFMSILYTETEPSGFDADTAGFGYIAFGARFKVRYQIGKRFESRASVSMGYGLGVEGSDGYAADLSTVKGFAIGVSLEAFFFVSDQLAVGLTWGIFGQPTGSADVGGDSEGMDVTIEPLMFVGFGFEFGK